MKPPKELTHSLQRSKLRAKGSPQHSLTAILQSKYAAFYLKALVGTNSTRKNYSESLAGISSCENYSETCTRDLGC